MLLLVGCGIDGAKGISIAALDELRKCDTVFAETFTSYITSEQLKELGLLIGKELSAFPRWYIEDGRDLIEKARLGNVALVTYGDPLIATTHVELRTRAAKLGIKTKVFHSASGVSSLIGETGLQYYKFGRTTTLMSDSHSAITVYNTIYENLLNFNHSLVLTEYDQSNSEYFLDPSKALSMLLDVEKDYRYGIMNSDTYTVVASRIGSLEQSITSGRLELLAKVNFGSGPHSIIVPSAMHFVERESLGAVSKCLSPVPENIDSVRTISTVMVEKYSPKAKQAAKQMREFIGSEPEGERRTRMLEVVDNAEYYILDSERFLRQRRPELAVLSIGYAEGLIDSLRFQKGINPWEKTDSLHEKP